MAKPGTRASATAPGLSDRPNRPIGPFLFSAFTAWQDRVGEGAGRVPARQRGEGQKSNDMSEYMERFCKESLR